MGYKLSVIVPVYNKADYIMTGLMSLLNQTVIKKLEIIIVDDGSTDKSSEILKDFCDKYKNFKYYYERNMGVSTARNTGLEKASSNLIGFFDIDDYVEPIYFQNLIENQQKMDSDITISDFSRYFSTDEYKKHRPTVIKYWTQKTEMLKDFFSGNYIGNHVCDKIFKKKILRDITFPATYAIGEDMYFVYEAIQKANSMYLNATYAGYHYIIREKSAMTSKFNSKFYDPVKLSQRMLDDNKGSLKEYAYVHLIHEKCKLLENMLKNNGVGENREVYKQYRKDIRKINIINAFKILNKKQFLGLILMSISPQLYLKIHDLMKIG